MKLGFYYHIPIVRINKRPCLPGFLAVFIESLASQVDKLVLILHEATINEYPGADHELIGLNIEWVNLGRAKPAWHRSFFPSLTLNKMIGKADIDCLLVRSPTPLAPSFSEFFKSIPVYFMIVGDYLEGAEHLKSSTLRDRIIYQYLRFFDKQFNKVISKSKIIVNSNALLKKYTKAAIEVSLVNTTTISDNDILVIKHDISFDSPIRLLFTGRIDPAKGVFELLDALAILNQTFGNIYLDIVGWEDSPDKPVEKKMIQKSKELNIFNRVVFHGRKSVGDELFSFYERAHIYVLPSYHEGFPRTIWEAMAKGLPVITTTVGGIPEYLTDRKNSILIPPKDIKSIVDAVSEVITNIELRNKIVSEAYTLVREVTLEKQTEKLVQIIRNYLKDE